jgi:subtilisin
MRRVTALLAAVGAMLILYASGVLAQEAPSGSRGGVERYIVVLENDVSSSGAIASAHARRYNARVTHTYEHALNGYAAEIPQQGLRGILHDPRVAFVEQDYVQHAFNHEIPNRELPTGINRIEGDQSSTLSGNHTGTVSVDIAVLDTGIQQNHPDLNVVGGYNCTSSKRNNFGDGHGHGTHVAGTAAAKDNGSGVVGVAPGARVWAMKVLNDNGSGFASWIICGIDRVTRYNTEATLPDIEVANMSLGGSGSDSSTCSSDAYHRAICNSTKAGVTYAVAAGNSAKDFKDFRPATFPEVLTATAVADFNGLPGGGAAATCRSDVDDTAANFSNWAVDTEDQAHTIAAPGVCIKSTWKGGGYNTISGTSMASPHVAGTAALCIASGRCKRDTNGDGTPDTQMTPSQIISKLRGDAAARSNNPVVSPYYGFTDDPKTPNGSRYYGYQEFVGGY